MGLFSLLGKKPQDPDDTDVPVKPRRSRAKTGDEEPIDPMLPEKKRARRRLIGATALVLAAIIGLPMVFDSEPKPLADDIAIQIPPRDKAPVNSADPMPLPPSQATAAAAKPDTPKPDVPKSDVHPEPAPPAPAVARAEPSKAEPAKPEPAVEKAAEKPAEKVADKAREKTDKAPEKPAAKPADKAVAKDKGRYIVQVAAVTNKAKGEELVNRLKKAGIKAYSQKVDTKDGERFRVRVGPVAGREEADKLRQRLGKMGLSGAIQSM